MGDVSLILPGSVQIPSLIRGPGGILLSFLILLVSLKPFKALFIVYILLGSLSSSHSVSSLRAGGPGSYISTAPGPGMGLPVTHNSFIHSFIQQMFMEGPLCTRLHERPKETAVGSCVPCSKPRTGDGP